MNEFYFILSSLVFITLMLIGYFRSKIEGRRPDSVLSINDLAIVWLTENNWLSRLSVVLLPLVFIYNALAWAIYGLATISDLLALLVKKIWQLLLIFYREVLEPGVLWPLRLLWHYPLGFSWRFFEFSFTPLSTSLRQDSILFSLRRLLLLGVLGSVLVILVLLLKHPAAYAISGILFFFALLYALFQLITYHRATQFPAEKIKPSMLMALIWLGIAVGVSLIIYLLRDSTVYAVEALGISLTQVLLPIGLLSLLAFFSAMTCLPAYYQKVEGRINTLTYLRDLLYRVPKLVYAMPFQVFGGAVVVLVPLLMVWGLNHGVRMTTDRDFKAWGKEVMTMGSRIPAIKQYRLDINDSKLRIEDAQKEIIQEEKNHQKDLADWKRRSTETNRLKDEIQDRQLHTFRGDAYVGETQFFSVPFINNCARYRWVIEKAGKQVAATAVDMDEPGTSVIVFHTWREAGVYDVILTPSSRCGDGQIIEKQVNVVNPPPGKKPIQRPLGKVDVCENEAAVYRTEKGFDSYEWRFPDGTMNTAEPQLSITWGRTSGTVQVRGLRNGQDPSLWRGINVEVALLPGDSSPGEALLADEENPSFSISRDFIFLTRELAQDSIDILENEKDFLIADHEQTLESLNDKIKAELDEIATYKQFITGEIHKLLGQIMAVFGLALALALLFSTAFTYLPLYHFDLYRFRDEGPHFWEESLAAIKNKNAQQPLLGFFILGILLLAYAAYVYWYLLKLPI